MKNNVYFIGLGLVLLFMIIVVGCSNGGVQERVGKENEYKDINLNISKESNVTLANKDLDNTARINGGKTLEEAIDYYIQEIESSMGLSGAFFSGKSKIIDTEETSGRVNVYAFVVSRWVDTRGNTVSDGSGVLRIGFKKENNLYLYKDFEEYKAIVTPYVPQKVSDIYSNDGKKIYNDLIEEIEKDIEKYLKPNH